MKKLKSPRFILLTLIILFVLDIVFAIITFILYKSILCKAICH
ncbi:MAG: hypothetical protein ACO2O4_04260 [Minisyncoccia bacterium]|jgi:hypothetical protein